MHLTASNLLGGILSKNLNSHDYKVLTVTDLPNKQDAVRGNSVPSPPFLLITTIFPSKGISKQLNLPCLANTKEKEQPRDWCEFSST